MKIIQIDNQSVNIQISFFELKVLNNTILEVYNGISFAEFKTRTGFYRVKVEQVRKLIIDSLGDSHIQQATIQLITDEVVILNNMLNEVCHGFAIENFAEKIGATKKEAQEILSIFNGIGKQLIKSREVNKKTKTTPVSPTIKQSELTKIKCFLKNSQYQFNLYLMGLTRKKEDVAIGATLDDIHNNKRLIKTTVTAIDFDFLRDLIFYLEAITNLSQDSQSDSQFYISYLVAMQLITNKYNLENVENLTLKLEFKENRIKFQSEEMESRQFQTTVNIESVIEFTSHIKDFLTKCQQS